MTYPLYEVTWYDHYTGNSRWTDLPEKGLLISKYLCTSLGYVICEDKDQIGLAQTLNDQDQYINLMVILKNAIKKKRKLK